MPGADRRAAGRRRRLRRRRLQRHRPVHGVHRRTPTSGSSASRPAATASRPAGTPRRSPPARSACCTAPARTCCRTRTARPSSRTRSRRAWTTRASGPEHSLPAPTTGRASYEPATDAEAMAAFDLLCKTEGIIPAIESAHAARRRAASWPQELGRTPTILVNLSGRGDKDVHTAGDYFGLVTAWRSTTGRRARVSGIDDALRPHPRREPRGAGRLPARRASRTSPARSRRSRRWSRHGVRPRRGRAALQRPGDGRARSSRRPPSRRSRPASRTADVLDRRGGRRRRRPGAGDDLLEPGRALRRRRVRRRPRGRGRGGADHPRPDPGRGRRVDRRLRRSTTSTGSSWSRRRRPTSGSR